MTDYEIISCVNDGANFYLRFFGKAVHMEYCKKEFYGYIRPKQGEHGVRFIFDVRLESLPNDRKLEKIAEIKSLDMPVWWDMHSSDALYRLIHGKAREKVEGTLTDGDELYMAILPDEKIDADMACENITIKKIDSPSSFAEWANAVNEIMFNGYADIHPVNHYHLCRDGDINCFICYDGDTVAAVSSVMDNQGVCSLEFVATAPNYRRKGFAKAVCTRAIKDAFENGASIITLRALQPYTRELYTSLGFKIYNYAL